MEAKNRIRYYLLDWKDSNLSKYQEKFGDKGMHTLSKEEMLLLYEMATKHDRNFLFYEQKKRFA